MPDACHSFLFAVETASNTIHDEARMALGIATLSDTCRQPGDGSGFRANSSSRPQEYSGSILGLIFLFFAEVITLAKQIQNTRRTRDLLLRQLSGQVRIIA